MSDKLSKSNPLAWLASLRLTVVLLALGMYLIFVGTLAQTEVGIWQVVHDYFRSLYVMVPFDVFRPILRPGSDTPWPGGHPFPGGFLIIGALLVNLFAAHAVRFKVTGKGVPLTAGIGLILIGSAVTAYTVLDQEVSARIQQDVLLMLGVWSVPMLLIAVGTWLVFGPRKCGIVLLHAGLILMLVGEFITGLGAEEGQMAIAEFGGSNTLYDIREAELAFETDAGSGKQQHVVISEPTLAQADEDDAPIQHEVLPVSVRVDAWMPNSELQATIGEDPANPKWSVVETETVTGTESRVDQPSAMITLFRGDQRLGQYMVSTWQFVRPVELEIDGRPWRISLRFRQTPLNYTLQLNDFRHDLFTGSRTARNYSSDLRLITAGDTGDRDAFIKMNEPLRYDGKAFFQSNFFQQPLNRNMGTILQVADNPGAWVPYLSCVIVTIGLVIQFGASLLRYARRSIA